MKKSLSMKDKHIYVVVMCDCPRFITSVQTEPEKVCEWKADQKPYEFLCYEDAWYVCMGLLWRGQYAFPVITQGYKQETPFYSVPNPEDYFVRKEA